MAKNTGLMEIGDSILKKGKTDSNTAHCFYDYKVSLKEIRTKVHFTTLILIFGPKFYDLIGYFTLDEIYTDRIYLSGKRKR